MIRILNVDRIPAAEAAASDADAFFAGSGGDGTVRDSLRAAGWRTVWAEASYYYVMDAADGDRITYVEGDVYRGDQCPAPG